MSPQLHPRQRVGLVKPITATRDSAKQHKHRQNNPQPQQAMSLLGERRFPSIIDRIGDLRDMESHIGILDRSRRRIRLRKDDFPPIIIWNVHISQSQTNLSVGFPSLFLGGTHDPKTNTYYATWP